MPNGAFTYVLSKDLNKNTDLNSSKIEKEQNMEKENLSEKCNTNKVSNKSKNIKELFAKYNYINNKILFNDFDIINN